MRPFESSEVSITNRCERRVRVKEGKIYTYMADGLHTVMVTKTGRPRECQAKAGDPRVFSGRTIIPPLGTWVERYQRAIDQEGKDVPLEREAPPQSFVCNVLY